MAKSPSLLLVGGIVWGGCGRLHEYLCSGLPILPPYHNLNHDPFKNRCLLYRSVWSLTPQLCHGRKVICIAGLRAARRLALFHICRSGMQKRGPLELSVLARYNSTILKLAPGTIWEDGHWDPSALGTTLIVDTKASGTRAEAIEARSSGTGPPAILRSSERVSAQGSPDLPQDLPHGEDGLWWITGT